MFTHILLLWWKHKFSSMELKEQGISHKNTQVYIICSWIWCFYKCDEIWPRLQCLCKLFQFMPGALFCNFNITDFLFPLNQQNLMGYLYPEDIHIPKLMAVTSKFILTAVTNELAVSRIGILLRIMPPWLRGYRWKSDNLL